ncbi:NHLP family bacteriocin export ABC transporter peptidase/permease/ATPase subunit [Desulfogranum japonicum]|uniref:NHLP family bacteriocin export ABC transporter peptidase/permease/ATPase subunit n=1 Tax=Desulfogranum japonicum TaxID=231447 RepID=UPI000550959B|nr:NHLP family bacteriocin export ABC transporter peptidase/permease/ATPase subunit [Desulfogranum japonicum]
MRAKTPTIIQMEAVECGAAALAIVLGYYKRFEPLEKLRVECGVTRDGSKANNILKVARQYGLQASGKMISKPTNLKNYTFPMIVFWNFNHFLVVEGFRGDLVYINDPATGPRTVSWEEFNGAFTGVTLLMEPGEQFEPKGSPSNVLASLIRRLKDYKATLLFIVALGLATILPGLAIPSFSKIFMDDIMASGHDDWANPLMWSFGVAIVFLTGVTLLQQLYILKLQIKLALVTSGKYILHIFKLPMVFYTQRHGGEVGSRVQLNDQVANLLGGDLATNTVNLATVAFYVVVMATYDVSLTAVGVLFSLVNLFFLRLISRKRTDLNRIIQKDKAKLSSTSMGGVQIIESLRASGQETDFFNRWIGIYSKVFNARQQLELPTQILSIMPKCLNQLMTATILSLGALRVMNGYLTIGSLVAFQGLMTTFSDPVNKLITLGSRLQEIEGDLNRVDDVMHYQADPVYSEDETQKLPIEKIEGSLTLADICFGYNPLQDPFIENFHLELRPGSRVALVGASGSGKSTVSRLISGLYKPWSGKVLLDGEPREDYTRQCICKSVSFVDQEIFLFQGTVKENITLWDQTILESQMIQAAKDACIHDEILLRAGGYNSEVDEGGKNFSGGQCQRLEIARALVTDPSIMILDEATSALDPVVEQAIDRNLRRRGITCLIIAHRLSTIRDSDEIIVMDKGKIVQRGRHEELIQDSDGIYATLIEN